MITNDGKVTIISKYRVRIFERRVDGHKMSRPPYDESSFDHAMSFVPFNEVRAKLSTT